MNNRICPSEEILSEYLSGGLTPGERAGVEKHLAGCPGCRKLLAEAHDVLKRPDIREIGHSAFRWVRKDHWLIGSVLTLACSFLCPRYFLQFLVASLLMGAKWIIDSKTTKMLIMIQEAWKSGDKEKTDKILSRFTPDK